MDKVKSASKSTQPKYCRPKWFCWIGLFLILSIIPAALYHIKNRPSLSPITESLAQFNIKITSQDETIKALSQKIEALEQKIATQDTKVCVQKREETSYVREDWILLKVRDLLAFAQNALVVFHNQKEAIQLLEAANTLILPLSQPALSSVKEALLEELKRLKALPKIKINTLLQTLDQLKKAIPNLTLHQETETYYISSELPPTKWTEHLSKLGNLITIRHYKETFNPWQTLFYESFLKETLSMELSQIQWALMQYDVKLYQDAKEAAVETLNVFGETEQLKTLQTLPESLPVLITDPNTFPPLKTLLPLLAHPPILTDQPIAHESETLP